MVTVIPTLSKEPKKLHPDPACGTYLPPLPPPSRAHQEHEWSVSSVKELMLPEYKCRIMPRSLKPSRFHSENRTKTNKQKPKILNYWNLDGSASRYYLSAYCAQLSLLTVTGWPVYLVIFKIIPSPSASWHIAAWFLQPTERARIIFKRERDPLVILSRLFLLRSVSHWVRTFLVFLSRVTPSQILWEYLKNFPMLENTWKSSRYVLDEGLKIGFSFASQIKTALKSGKSTCTDINHDK